MAGQRKGTGKPLKWVNSAQRRRAKLEEELQRLSDPRDRVFIAADYVRAALSTRTDAEAAERVVAVLTREGDRILGLEDGEAP